MTSSIPPDWHPRPEDELLHEPYGDESFPWKETWFISLCDATIGANLTMHMTRSANRSPSTRCCIAAAQGNRMTDQIVRADGTHDEHHVGNQLSRLENINLSWDSNHKLRWIGTLDDLEFDLILTGQHFAPLWDTMFHGYYATGKTDGQFYCHTEQVIIAEGTLKWKGEKELPFKGIGWRDRGWGRRKTQAMWDSGWDLLAAVMPDESVWSIIALRSHEFSKEEPQPVAGWYSDATSLSPCTGGVYHKDSNMWPRHVELEFLDGHRIVGDQVRRAGTVVTSMQEAEVSPESPGFAASMRDHYAIMADDQGREFLMFSQCGVNHKVDAFRNPQFIYREPAAVPAGS
ncbi:MAG TPA: hypothetical protein VHX88_04505 [Solirubrobacteraceae bacterium]|jgi:hypothetical protein|nr:hypothetical protein [Solirubrobacteraceae bacterium]